LGSTTNDDIGIEELVAIVRPHAHGIEMYANEIRMIPIEPMQAPTTCEHQPRSSQQPSTA